MLGPKPDAPDLLKTAKAVLARIEDCCECPRSCRDCMALDEAREMLQALIAKAKGDEAG